MATPLTNDTDDAQMDSDSSEPDLQEEGSKSECNSEKRIMSCDSPEACPICQDSVRDRAVLELCLHTFCYQCISEWSKRQTKCPLCKRSFNKILTKIISDDDYKEVYVEPTVDEEVTLTRPLVSIAAGPIIIQGVQQTFSNNSSIGIQPVPFVRSLQYLPDVFADIRHTYTSFTSSRQHTSISASLDRVSPFASVVLNDVSEDSTILIADVGPGCSIVVEGVTNGSRVTITHVTIGSKVVIRDVSSADVDVNQVETGANVAVQSIPSRSRISIRKASEGARVWVRDTEEMQVSNTDKRVSIANVTKGGTVSVKRIRYDSPIEINDIWEGRTVVVEN